MVGSHHDDTDLKKGHVSVSPGDTRASYHAEEPNATKHQAQRGLQCAQTMRIDYLC